MSKPARFLLWFVVVFLLYLIFKGNFDMENSNDIAESEIRQDEDSNSNASSTDSLDKEKRLAINKELQQLAFVNPGRLTVTAGFNPEFSNREKRKLSRLMEQQSGRADAGKGLLKSKPRRKALHDASGYLEIDGRDVCDCQDPLCPGCHFPCSLCDSEKCGSTCRCNRRWSYDHVDVYNAGNVMR